MALTRPDVDPHDGPAPDRPASPRTSPSATAPRPRRAARSTCTTSASRTRTGEEFDASWNRGTPLRFPLGTGRVIAGWDQGVQGMKVGGRRRLVIPPHLGYGDRGAGGAIKPGETLIFVVDLVGVS